MQGRSEVSDVRQRNIKDHLILFLKKYSTGRDSAVYARLSEELTKGYCSGITTVWLYSNWLEQQIAKYPDKFNAAIADDINWFKTTRQTIINWDGNRELTVAEQREFDRYLSLIEYFQHISDYDSIGQGDLHKFKLDTKDRQLQLNYPIGGLFTKNEAANMFQSMMAADMFKDQFVLFSSINHATGLFQFGQDYDFFDSNNPTGAHTITNGAELADNIFAANRFEEKKSSPLGVRIFGFEPLARIIPQIDFLSSTRAVKYDLLIPISDDYFDGASPLHMAVRIGDIEGVQFYLSLATRSNANFTVSDLINYENKNLSSPISWAINWNRPEILAILLVTGQGILKQSFFSKAIDQHLPEVLAILFEAYKEIPLNSPHHPKIDLYHFLKKAVLKGHADIVEILLQHGGTVTQTLLALALNKGYVDVLDVLLKKAKADGTKIDLENLLHLAAAKDHPQTIALLLKYGADINEVRQDTGKTALHIALERGHIDSVNALLADKKVQFSIKDKENKTILNSAFSGLALLESQLKFNEKELISAKEDGAKKDISVLINILNKNIKNYHGLIDNFYQNNQIDHEDAYIFEALQSNISNMEKIAATHPGVSQRNMQLLVWACSSGKESLVDCLLKQPDVDINLEFNKKLPLQAAIYTNQLSLAEFLLKNGADPNLHTSFSKAPIEYALRTNNLPLVNLLLNYHAKTDEINPPALITAIKSNKMDVSMVLLDHQVNVHVTDENGMTALHHAVSKGNLSAIDLLLKHGANIYSKNLSGETPLQLAVEKGWNDVTERLLKEAVRIENNDSTALHIAIKNGYLRMAAFLLTNMKSNPMLEHTLTHALSLACEKGMSAIIALLLEKGANANGLSKDITQSPLFIAAKNGHQVVVDELLDYKDEKRRALINGHFDQLQAVTSDDYILDRLRTRNYLEYRSHQRATLFGVSKDQRLSQAKELEIALKSGRQTNLYSGKEPRKGTHFRNVLDQLSFNKKKS